MRPLLLTIVAILIPALVIAGENTAATLKDLDGRVYPSGSEEAKEAPQRLSKWLQEERRRINAENTRSWHEAQRSKESWEAFRAPRIERLRASLGDLPPLPDRIETHVARTLKGEGFLVDNLVYRSRPEVWVTANLYRPNPVPKSAPGFVIIHSHHNPKTQGELQDMGMTWARLGCYVLIPDQLGHGERRQHPFVNDKSYPKPFKVGRQDYFFRYNVNLQLQLAGDSLMGWMVNDLRAGVSLLLQQPALDPGRIILLGSVAGGGDPAGVTAALDPRIQCVAPFNFGGPQPETRYPLPDDAEASFNYLGGGSWESTRNLRYSGSDGFLPWLVVGSVAPRHIIHAHEFAWDGARDPVWKRYQRIFALHGASDRLAVAHGKGSLQGKYPESTHCNNIGPEHRAMIYPALTKWFDIPSPEKEVRDRRPSEDLACWTPELRAKLQPKPVHEIAATIREKRRRAAKDDSASVVASFARHVVRAQSVEKRDGLTVRKLVLEHPTSGLQTPVLILAPQRPGGKVVVALAQEGKEAFLKNRSGEIAGLLHEGITVALPDLPGTGETRVSGDSRGRTSSNSSLSATAQMLGTNLMRIRLEALHQVLRHLKAGEPGSPAIALWGDSFARVNGPDVEIAVPHDASPSPNLAEPMGGLLSLYAAVVMPEVRAVLGRGTLVSYASVLRSPFLHVPHDALIPPFAEAAELDDLVVRVLERPGTRIRLESLVTGVNRRATQEELNTSFARSLASGPAGERFTLRGSATATEETVAWLVRSLQ